MKPLWMIPTMLLAQVVGEDICSALVGCGACLSQAGCVFCSDQGFLTEPRCNTRLLFHSLTIIYSFYQQRTFP